MHGVKRSLVCFVAVASANPPFIQPSETSRETTESMNDGLIKLITGDRFLLNTPTAQQNHPRARRLRVATAAPAMRRHSNCTAPHTHTASSKLRRVIQRPEGSVRFMVGPPLRGIEAEILLCCVRSQVGVVPCHKFFPGSAAFGRKHGAERLQQLHQI